MDYYDYVLGIIPSSLVGIAGALMVAGFESVVAVPIAAVVSIGVISHAVFVNGPVDAPPRPRHEDRTDQPNRRSTGQSS